MRAISPIVLAAGLAACGDGQPVAPTTRADAGADVATVADAMTEADAGVCEASADQPLARGDAAGAVDPVTGAFYLFGGDVGPVVTCMARPMFSDETWRYDTRCNRWTRLSPEAHPSARSRAAYAVDARRRRMLVFGGRSRAGSTGAYTLYRELWSLDMAEGRWELLSTKGEMPTARANATMVVDAASDGAVLFGGNTSVDGARFTPRNDAWRLDLATLQWSRIADAGAPPARQFHAAAVRDGAMVVVGGGDSNAFLGPFLADAWRLDLATGQWSELALTGATDALGARISHGLVARADDLVLVGGHDDGALGNRNDVLTVDGAGDVAERSAGDTLQTPGNGFCDFPPDFAAIDEGSPERRSAFVMAEDPARQRVIVYGGKTDCGTASDVWSLDLRTLAWTALRGTTDGLACGRTGRESCRSLCQ